MSLLNGKKLLETIPYNHNETRLLKFRDIVNKYEINHDFALRIRGLEGFEIVLICDDSGSMSTPVIDTTNKSSSPFHQFPSRWDELKHTVSIVVDLAATLDPDGVDIYFLNRQPMLSVKQSSELQEHFAMRPHGLTPITKILSYVLEQKRSQIYDRKLLILIATDGLPTDEQGAIDLINLEDCLKNDRGKEIDRIYITFIACTNDLNSVGYLNEWDKKIKNIDVVDDYVSERNEIWAVQGKKFPFSYGDYVVKLLMGAVDPWFDQLDEKKVKLTETKPLDNVDRRKSLLAKKNCTIS
ncbi:unnamed protein product [Didymodactylos carnosus]|uniref:VWFA domain-containing protein n=1 Tax=Didymodactylos carnosus TaxID=1234261 RepID=A0A814S9E8_9BILA|nr:unnamed protein product [Didymodactylos carnosus]CAF1143099.1 unnamed protein product [Didymodactylos carnosus]CAF3906725.1 unnamed protein product [Didymodactylos carnosus]CAF3917806.1 unnamed protein product [Didymodactylos carnosus]